MDVKTIQQLYDYNYWAHRRVWKCVTQLSEEELDHPIDYSIGSIRAQLVHTMSAEDVWFSRMAGYSPAGLLHPADFPTKTHIRTKWNAIEQHVRTVIGELDAEKLAGDIVYQRTNGEKQSTPLLDILLHLINHGTDHRAQTLAAIDQIGGETIAQDLIVYLRQQTV